VTLLLSNMPPVLSPGTAGVQWSWVQPTDKTSPFITITPSTQINKLLITSSTFTAEGVRHTLVGIDSPLYSELSTISQTHGALTCIGCARQLVLRDVRCVVAV
jgi:hypothetical protein